ncbi:uncharacterized protein EV422DRAFT_357661 [Fimicolochytrium jonesii]|uniref:uncharacterized protein n=1 Tax=Fimicolochytrium jonesii TaxID=1396493 RepID=UPI0022FE882B|nr:uncharacterized protein EV422DRAFT_357661 [Fimicolochytrium jonesii]KAI8823496.1 hypothetical protein EV422DRAFT_357661 [Fimicolochytrium jonesii]
MAIDIGALMQTCPRKVHFWTKSELFHGLPGLTAFMTAMGCLPVKRNSRSGKNESNDDLFESTITTLLRGGVIAIFPEGTSHHTPKLFDLKDGASWAALQYAKAVGNPANYAPIVPVGITYEPLKWRWRNRLHVRFGKAIEVTDFLKEFELDQRAAVKRLTARLQETLSALTVNAPTWEALDFTARVQALTVGHDRGWQDLAVGSAASSLTAANDSALDSLNPRVTAYFSRLAKLGLKDIDVESGSIRNLSSLATDLLMQFVFTILAMLYELPFTLFHLPALLLLSFFNAREKFPESKAQIQIFGCFLALPINYTIWWLLLTIYILGAPIAPGSLTPPPTVFHSSLLASWYITIAAFIFGLPFPRAEDLRRHASESLKGTWRVLRATIVEGRETLREVVVERGRLRSELISIVDKKRH